MIVLPNKLLLPAVVFVISDEMAAYSVCLRSQPIALSFSVNLRVHVASADTVSEWGKFTGVRRTEVVYDRKNCKGI